MERVERSADGNSMGSENKDPLKVIEALYDQNMFIDAFRLCRNEYKKAFDPAKEDARRILLLGRLACRLGGRKLQKKLFNIARGKAPDDPLVLHFAGKSPKSYEHLLIHLEEIDSFPVDRFETDPDKASWLATAAWAHAMVRDFEKAHRFLSDAFALNTDRAWGSCCRAEVLCLEDRWREALTAAEEAWELSPGMPQAAATLGKILTKTGKIKTAAARLLAAAVEKQSYETLLTAVWYLCAVAERSTNADKMRLAHRALGCMKRVERLAPLADDDLRSHIALMHVDIAWLTNDHEHMRAQARKVQHPFYRSVLENIDKKGPSDVRITAYQPVFQKHNTCLPTSVAAVLAHFGVTIDADALARELTFHGTAIWRVVDWLAQQDLTVKVFIVDAGIAKDLLTNNLPFVVMVKSVHYYHAMAAVGLDEAAGVLLVHDPAGVRLDKMLLSELCAHQAPFGLEAMAVAPRGRDQAFDRIPDAAREPFSAFIAYQKSRATIGLQKAGQVFADMKKRFGDHPFVLRTEALHLGARGKPAAAIKRQEHLLNLYPDCEHIRQELLASLHRTGNRGLIRKVLSRIVLKKKMPGIRATQKWRYAPAEYVAQYATYAGMVKTGVSTAVRMLWGALEKNPSHAGCYHVLGDVYAHDGENEKSLLPLRCAATLELENHHYARAYVDALARMNRIQEGFFFLKHRTGQLGDSVAGGEIWITQIGAYEDYGYPDEAIESLNQALLRRPDDACLLSWAVRFWGRMGLKQQEQQALSALERTGHRPSYLSAAVSFHRLNGNRREALAFCTQWLNEEPDNMDARREYVDLWSMDKGMRAALALTEKWMTDYAGNDDFEIHHYDYLKSLFKHDAQLDLLRARLLRNPYDTWAQRELAFTLVYVIDIGENRDQTAIRKEFDVTIAKCKALSADEAVLFVLQSEMAAYDGKFKEAARLCLKAIRREPDYTYAYGQAWRYAGKLAEDARKKVFTEMEKNMFKCTGFFCLSKDLAQMAAEVFGNGEAHRLVDGWLKKRPFDPEITKAKAHLLLQCGQGRTDAEKAVAMLSAEAVRFPNHADFKFLLSRAYRILQDEEKWVRTSDDILKQFPLSSIQRRQLAEYYQLNNDFEKARTLLIQGVDFTPLDEWVRHDLIALLFKEGKHQKAIEWIGQSLEKIPESIGFRNRIIELLFDQGEDELAVETAKGGIEVYPDGSTLWKYYADALWRSRTTADMKGVEAAYRKALRLNPRHLDAADRLAELITYQNRFEEAKTLITDQKPYHVDQGPLLTRLAWIERQAGNKADALDQLCATVEKWPRERWAWHLLLEWIKADEKWDLAKKVLGSVHPVMQTDPDFVSEKLYVLHKAGVGDETLGQEWRTLLHDYPENEKIHCLRFDLLYENEQFDEAQAVLAAVEKYDPDSPYLLARRTALCTDQLKFDQAVAVSMKLMTLPYDTGSWCRQKVLDAFKAFNKLNLLIEAGLNAWRQGAPIEAAWFRMLIGHIEAVWKGPGPLSRYLTRWGIKPAVVRRLSELIAAAMGRDDRNGSYTAAILDRIEDHGYRGMLIDFAKHHPDFSRTRTYVWQIIGHALVSGPDRQSERARRWLTPWREHPSCEFWVISNLIVAIDKSRSLKPNDKSRLIMEHAKDAVQTLPSDHTFQYVICKYCEAALRLGKDDAFMEWSRQYGNILEDNESGYWVKEGEGHLTWSLLQFKKLLTAAPSDLPTLSAWFKKRSSHHGVPGWVRKEWKRRCKTLSAR